jgi:hypothetical protein
MSGTWRRSAAVCRRNSGTARKAAGWHLTPFADEFIFSAMDFTSSRWLPIVLLVCSNIFMTFAWRGSKSYLTIKNMISYFKV